MTEIHSCSYYCDRPGCIKAQRDELRDRLAQPEQKSFSPEAISATQAAWKMGYDAAKAEQPEQEPVEYWTVADGWVSEQAEVPAAVWVEPEFWEHCNRVNCGTAYRLPAPGRQPLYTAPPQRKPLTDEQIAEALGFGEHTTATTRAILTHAARAIEAKIKENT